MKSFFTFLVAAAEVYQLALKAEPGNDAAKQALTKLGIELSNPATR